MITRIAFPILLLGGSLLLPGAPAIAQIQEAPRDPYLEARENVERIEQEKRNRDRERERSTRHPTTKGFSSK